MLLGADLDEKVQLYLKKVREGGGVVTARIAMAAAKGILMSSNRGALVEFEGHISITKSWAILTTTTNGICSEKMHYIKIQALSVTFQRTERMISD